MPWTKIVRPHHDRRSLRYASDCTDEEWLLIMPFMPARSKVGRPRRTRMRAVWNAVQYIVSGVPSPQQAWLDSERRFSGARLAASSREAARRSPSGFPHYHDRGELFSANMMKAFRARGLFPTPEHVIYSFRDAFEKRMQEATIDYGLRCLLMAHRIIRPAYGDGGSLAYRRDELLKIAHPYSPDVFRRIDEAFPDRAAV